MGIEPTTVALQSHPVPLGLDGLYYFLLSKFSKYYPIITRGMKYKLFIPPIEHRTQNRCVYNVGFESININI